MAGFFEIRFPDDISYGVTGGPEFKTDIVTVGGGQEQRNINWQQARRKYNAYHGVKVEDQFNKLLNFFHVVNGKGYGFRFKDWSDYKAQYQAVAWGDGATTQFQCCKNYVVGSTAHVRTIKKLVAGTVRVFFFSTNSAPTWDMNGQQLGTEQFGNWSVDINTGIFTLNSPLPTNTLLLASSEFDVPARFDTDYMPASIKEWNSYEWSNIPILELRC